MTIRKDWRDELQPEPFRNLNWDGGIKANLNYSFYESKLMKKNKILITGSAPSYKDTPF